MCGHHRHFAPLLPRTLLRIPETVGTVATTKDLGIGGIKIASFQYRKR